MTLARRDVLCLAAVWMAALGHPVVAVAQNSADRPLRIIVTFPPGSTPDFVARVVGNKVGEQMRRLVIVDARPGGSGVIGAEIAKNAAPDGRTLLMVGTTLFATLPALKPKLPYDTEKDFIALSRVASVANVLAVYPTLGVGTVAELVALAKARPGELNYGSSGNGTAPHLAGEMFNLFAGVKTVHVPYKGTPLALNDLVAGQLQFIMTSPGVVMPHARAGKIKVIATLGTNRDPLLPDLPPAAETIPGLESTLWWGLALPAKTPAAVVNSLHGEIVKAMQSSEVRERLAKQSTTAHAESPAEFSAFIRVERERIGRIGRGVSIALD